MHPLAIETDNLTVSSCGRPVAGPVTFRVERGETALLFGASGSGKTTILRALMGFSEKTSGTVNIHGRLLKGHSIWGIRQGLMSYVPQEVDLGPGTVRDSVMRPFSYRANRSIGWDEARARELMEKLRLHTSIMDNRARELSGGEKHRVALTVAVMLGRPVMLLDEITAGLDRAAKLSVLDLISSLSKVTVLAASHDELFRERAGKVIEIA